MTKKTIAYALLAFLSIGLMFCVTVPTQAAVKKSSRIVGDANADSGFNVKDLVRVKKYLHDSDNVEIASAADLDWNDSITEADVDACRKNLVNNTVIMEMPALSKQLKVVSMIQDGATVKLTLKNISSAWITDESSKVVFTAEGLTRNPKEAQLGRLSKDGQKECSITLTGAETKVSAEVQAEYWSIPVK